MLASPMRRHTTTRPLSPPRAFFTAPSRGLLIVALPSNECFQTMGAPTGLTCGETPAKNSPSSRSGLAVPSGDDGKVKRFHRTMADGWALRPLLSVRIRAPEGTRGMAASLQPPPASHCLRQSAALYAIDQCPRSVQLGVSRGRCVQLGRRLRSTAP